MLQPNRSARPIRAARRALLALAFAAVVPAAVPSPVNALVEPQCPDTPYRDMGGWWITLDVYMPQGIDCGETGHGPFPAVVIVHGSWENASKDSVAGESVELARNGFVAFAIDYRAPCDPAAPDPRMDPRLCGYRSNRGAEDAAVAVQWVRDHAAEYNVLATQVGAIGGSGGGTLVLMLATWANGPGGFDVRSRPDAVVSWSGFTQLWRYGDSANPSRMYKQMTDYVGCPYEGPSMCRGRWHEASPWSFASSDDAPAFIANGTTEITPLQNARNMAEALMANGVEHALRILPGDDHSRKFKEATVDPCGTTVFQESMEFLHEHLPGPPAELPPAGPAAGPLAAEMTIMDATVMEGHEGVIDATFDVVLSEASDIPVTAAYETNDGTAESGTDHASRTGTVTFPPGDRCEAIRVPVRGDRMAEETETFSVVLTVPANATLVDGEAVGTIGDDDSLPTITSFSPSAGRVGRVVLIEGTRLSGVTGVFFDAARSRRVTILSDTAIEARVPYGALTGPITVASPAGTATSEESFRVKPKVTSFSPDAGPPGTEVVISGGALTRTLGVSFAGVEAAFEVVSYEEVRARVPEGATTGPIEVRTDGGRVESANDFQVVAPASARLR